MKDRRYAPVTYVLIVMQSPSQAPQGVWNESSVDLVTSLFSILPHLAILLLLVDDNVCDVDL